jgi:hypothetical protein
MSQPNKRSRITFVNRDFQYKYTAIMIGIAAAVSAVLGVMLLDSYREIHSLLNLVFETPAFKDKVDVPVVLRVFNFSIVFLVVEVLAIGVLGLVITNRVCGPVFIIERHLTTLLEGKYPGARQLRAGDEFVATFEVLTAVIELLKKRDETEAEVLTRTISAARQAGVAEAEVAALQRLVDERRARVRSD